MNDRLSQIVDEMAKGSMSKLMSRPVRVAIAKKYQKMEEALSKLQDGSGCSLHTCGLVAHEALAFDPLA